MRISDWSSDVCSSDLGGLRVGGDARQAGSEQRLIGGGFGAPRAGDGQHGFVEIDTARVGRSGGAGGEAEPGREEQGGFHGHHPGSFLVSIVVRCSAQLAAEIVWECLKSSTSLARSWGVISEA